MAVEQSNGAAPVGDPVAPSDRAALALATAAQALLAAIECLRGGTPPGLLTVPGLSPSAGQSLSVVEVVNEFMVAKARAGRSDRYLRQLRVSLSSFSRGRSHVPLTAVTVSDVEQWLFNRGWSPRTMRGYLADVRTLFNFAIRRGYQMRSPASAVELPCDASMHEPPAIHTPRQLAQLLTTARTADLDVCRHLAIRYFTGVRSAEAHRLREENILADYVDRKSVV